MFFKFLRYLSCCIPLITTFLIASSLSEPTFSIKFNQAVSQSHISGSPIAVNDDGIKKLPTGETAMHFGRRNILSVPLSGKIGNSGTLIWQFALENTSSGTVQACPMVTLNTSSRTKIMLLTFAGHTPPILQYSVGDGIHQIHHQQKLQFDRLYTAVLSFDGQKIRCFLNGLLVHEAKQPVTLSSRDWRSLFVGPYKDSWQTISPWSYGTLAKKLQLYNHSLNAEEIAKISGLKSVDISRRYPKILTVPCFSKINIQADGKLDENYWRKGASLIHLIDLTHPEKSWRIPEHDIRFLSDNKNLYIGFSSILPAGNIIKTGHDSKAGEKEVWGSESFELYILNNDKHYRFGGNIAGGYIDSVNTNTQYNPKWTYRTTSQMRIDDTTVWQGEIIIPWESIGLGKSPSQKIKFNFCRTWMLNDRLIISALSRPNKGYDDRDGYMSMITEPSPVMRIYDHNDPSYGNLKLQTQIQNPTQTRLVYQITMENTKSIITPETIFNQEILPESSLKIPIDVPITNSLTDTLVFTLKEKNGRKIFQQQIIPIKVSPEYLTVTPLFSKGKIEVQYYKKQVEARYGDNFSGKLCLVNSDGQQIYSKPAIEETIFSFNHLMPPGTYKIKLYDVNQSHIIAVQSFYFPGWGKWKDQSFSPRILPPYTPLEVKNSNRGKTVTMWGRDFTLDSGQLFPVSMTSQKQKLLSTPIELRLNHKKIPDTVTTHWERSTPHRFEYSAESHSSFCKLTSRAWIEYDGIAFYTVNLKAKENLKTAELVFNLPRHYVKYLHAAGGGAWGTKITDRIYNGIRKLNYYPMIYLGDEEKGFCFFTESKNSWRTKSRYPFILTANFQTVELKIEIASSLKKNDAFTFEFGLLGTPVKKLPDNYPLNTMGGRCELNRPGKLPTTYSTFINWMPGQTHGDCLANLPSENNPLLQFYQKEIKRTHHFQCKAFPYLMAMDLSDEYPEIKGFLTEWQKNPNSSYPYTKNKKKYHVQTICPTTEGMDFYVWNTIELLKNAHFDGVYFDFGTARNCNNHLHGCYDRTPILAFREYLRKIATALIESGAKDYIIVLHNTDCVQIPAFTFATHLFNGEHIRQSSSALLHDGKDILDSYPLAMFALELNSLPFGLTNSAYMPADVLQKKFGGGKEDDELYNLRMTRAMLAGMLIHNSISAMNRCHYGIFDKITRIYNRFGVPRATFYGYYHPRNPARIVKGKEVYASCYRHADDNRLLAIISHLGNQRCDQTIQVRFQPEILGMNPFTQAIELIDGPDSDYNELFKLRSQYNVPKFRAPLKWQSGGAKVISFQEGILTLELKAHTFALVEIR